MPASPTRRQNRFIPAYPVQPDFNFAPTISYNYSESKDLPFTSTSPSGLRFSAELFTYPGNSKFLQPSL